MKDDGVPRETRKTFDTMNETARVRGSKVRDKSEGEMSRGSESILRGGDNSYEHSARVVSGTLCQTNCVLSVFSTRSPTNERALSLLCFSAVVSYFSQIDRERSSQNNGECLLMIRLGLTAAVVSAARKYLRPR